MAFERISEDELASVGVELLDDLPGLAPDAMKAKFEETAKKLLAPKYNKMAQQLEAETASESLGAKVPQGLPEEIEKTVQAVLLALMQYVRAHEENQENPHSVTAAQVGAYTKAQTDQAINEKVVEIGGGDMAMAVYDPDMKKKPIYESIEANASMYTAIYKLNGWKNADENAKGKGYLYQQTVTLTSDDPKAPMITADSKFRPGIGTPKTGVAKTDDILTEALNVINDGVTTVGEGTVTTLVREKPASDVPVVWTFLTGV